MHDSLEDCPCILIARHLPLHIRLENSEVPSRYFIFFVYIHRFGFQSMSLFY